MHIGVLRLHSGPRERSGNDGDRREAALQGEARRPSRTDTAREFGNAIDRDWALTRQIRGPGDQRWRRERRDRCA
ncbi:MAG TPA: hypothetical protein VGF95_15525 [Solirubrobacteraceae bacterium]|jgi:hypothetical protein